MDKNKVVLYQINPNMFTHQGTLKDASNLLPHLASIGVNVVYLFSICKADDDENKNYWSERQKKSELNNPKNPYRIYDYFEIDEQYGGNEQLKSFIKKAHRLKLKVMMDLVYLHCSPNAKLLDEVPDGVQKDENGNIKYTEYHFPLLNYNSKALREYLIKNMMFYVEEFDVDGFRCDVGDGIALDFWKEAVDKIRKIKPDFLMFNEGRKPDYVKSGVFDYNYNWTALCETKDNFAEFLVKTRDDIDKNDINGQGVYFVENHDIVTDVGRADNLIGIKRSDCLYVFLFTVDGIPLLYCGEEIADCNEHSLFASKTYNNRGYGVDWFNCLLKNGKSRLSLIKKLVKLRLNKDELAYGRFSWLECDKNFISYKRTFNGKEIVVYINFGKEMPINCHGEILLCRGLKNGTLKTNGFAIFEK